MVTIFPESTFPALPLIVFLAERPATNWAADGMLLASPVSFTNK
jgi:hypothetical protein